MKISRGRPLGSKNRRIPTAVRQMLEDDGYKIPQMVIELLNEDGMSPYEKSDVLLRLMEFMYPKLRAVEVNMGGEKTTLTLTEQERLQRIDQLHSLLTLTPANPVAPEANQVEAEIVDGPGSPTD